MECGPFGFAPWLGCQNPRKARGLLVQEFYKQVADILGSTAAESVKSRHLNRLITAKATPQSKSWPSLAVAILLHLSPWKSFAWQHQGATNHLPFTEYGECESIAQHFAYLLTVAPFPSKCPPIRTRKSSDCTASHRHSSDNRKHVGIVCRATIVLPPPFCHVQVFI